MFRLRGGNAEGEAIPMAIPAVANVNPQFPVPQQAAARTGSGSAAPKPQLRTKFPETWLWTAETAG